MQTNKDCGFFRWLDEECSDWYKVLRDLRDAVWKLKKERNTSVAEEVMDSAIGHGEEVEKMNHFL
jgi:hypothetical protein